MFLETFINKIILRIDEPEPDGFFDDIDWRTFRIDEAIWNDRPGLRPDITYYRSLQVCYEQLLNEARDSYLYNVPQLIEKFNEVHTRRCELETELAIAKGEIQALQERLISATKFQTVGGKKNEIRDTIGMPLEEHKPTASRSEDSTRFTSNSGASKQENMMLASAYYENGWSLEEIAEKLQVSAGSVRVYLSSMKKHYEVKFIQGQKMICFDSDFGEINWDLCLYEKLEDKHLQKVVNLYPDV